MLDQTYLDTSDNKGDMAGDMAYLRADSLKVLLLFVGLVAYVWGGYLLVIGEYSGQIWIGPLGLLLSVLLGYLLSGRGMRLRACVPVLCVIGTLAFVMAIYRPQTTSYLFPLVPLLAGMLLDGVSLFALASLSAAVVIAVGRLSYGWSLLSPEVACPVLLVYLTAISSWLSMRNLNTALNWAWSNYLQALQSEKRLRDRQEELKRTLKALDEASYRIRRMNYQLALATERAEEARRLKQQFAANISHELRTPLNLIVGFSEMMFLSPESYGGVRLPPPYRGDVDAIYRSGQHLLSLIDDVLDLSQIEAGRMALTKERINLKDMIEEAVDIIDSLMEAKGLSLRVEVPDDVPLVYADRTRLRQVLLNLLNNSFRFTERGGITVRVEVEETEVVVSIADTGVGIPQSTIPHIFEEFYPLEGPTTRRGGRGLGLPLSKRFVELHGGRIWVESQVGQGSAFYFSLPLPEFHTESLYEGTPPAAHISPFPTPSAKSFLLLNSDPAVTRILQRHIEGYRAVEAHDESEALRLIEEHHPRAIVAGADGQGGGRSILEDAPYDLPLIVCPLLDRPWARLALSADDYLVKPITRERLFGALDRVDGEVKSVLVVDDTPPMVRLLDRMLKSGGREYRVVKAYSGEQALALMEQERPDVVLLDLVMPGMEGSEVLRRMRENTELADVPVIVITVREYLQELLPSEDMVQVKRKGGFSASELVNCLEAILDSLAPQPTFPASAPAQPATSPG